MAKEAKKAEVVKKSEKHGKSDEGKTYAIVAYITWIGLLIAFILNNEKKHDLASFHIRQSLLLTILAIVVGWIPVVGWIIALVLFVFWILGLISAIHGEKKEVPVIGKYAQQWFKSI